LLVKGTSSGKGFDSVTADNFSGDGRVYVSVELRDRIREAYDAHGWRSSRHAAAATEEVGEPVSHQTIENFLDGRWTSTERRVLRSLIAIHDLDPDDLSPLVPIDGDGGVVEWTVTLPRRLWVLDGERRERALRAFVALLDMQLDMPGMSDEDDDEDEVAARRAR